MYFVHVAVLFLASLIINLTESTSHETITTAEFCLIYTNGVCLPKGYNKLMPPENTTLVNVSFRVEHIEAIHDSRNEIDLMAILGLSWKEDRFNTSSNNGNQHIPLNIHWLDWVWVPDLYIYQMRSIKTLELLNNPYTSVCKYLYKICLFHFKKRKGGHWTATNLTLQITLHQMR